MSKRQFARNLLRLFDRRERWFLALLLAMMVTGAALELLGIGVIVPFLGILATPEIVRENRWLNLAYERLGFGSTRDFLVFVGGILLLVFIAKNAYAALLTYVQHRFAYNKQISLSRRLLGVYLRSPWQFHLQHNTAVLLRNVNSEAMSLIDSVVVPALLIANEALVFVCILALLVLVEPVVAVVTLGAVGVAAYGFQRVVKPALYRRGMERTLHGGELYKWASQGLGSVKEAKVLGREEHFLDGYQVSGSRYARSTLYFALLTALPRLVIETLAVAALLIATIVVMLRGGNLADMLPVLGLFAVAAARLIPSLNRMLSALSSIRFYAPVVESIAPVILAAADPLSQGASATRQVLRAPRPSFTGQLTFRDVWFRYEGAADWALKGVSFAISKGRSTALVGPSGAGKSTVVDIILGLLRPQRGALLLDGRDLEGVMAGWRTMIGYVPQASYLLDDTVRRNVAFGVPDAEIDDGKVWAALRVASLEEKIRELPGALDAPIGERGARLSGGEPQRVGIARALYHDPEVLIFDEATSSLDATTEQAISRALAALTGRTTLVFIAHRLSTVQHCDQLVFMNDGSVEAVGPFSTLIERNRIFADLVRDQRLFMSAEELQEAGIARGW